MSKRSEYIWTHFQWNFRMVSEKRGSAKKGRKSHGIRPDRRSLQRYFQTLNSNKLKDEFRIASLSSFCTDWLIRQPSSSCVHWCQNMMVSLSISLSITTCDANKSIIWSNWNSPTHLRNYGPSLHLNHGLLNTYLNLLILSHILQMLKLKK